ncbi:MAG: viperin family antiviral radical SAM protein [Deltaproteobacteria bacterium]|nr:viperin family antiviral radical SAM protein [Deltaproteobacteria bacterium]
MPFDPIPAPSASDVDEPACATHPSKPVAVNFHLWRPCNDACTFCFATFDDVRGHLTAEDAVRLIGVLRAAGTEKLNFAGGEPTLCPYLGEVLREARAQGLVVTIISNGFALEALLECQAGDLDWVGLSVDSAVEQVQAALGRGRGNHVARTTKLFDLVHAYGLRAKLNTVVTARTWDEDMTAFVRRVRPHRWKVFQVLPVGGQNDGRVEPLLIAPAQFRAFVDRHLPLGAEGFAPVVEDNAAMTASYVMIDPLGRFFSNATGRHVYSKPILDVGVEAALEQITWDAGKFVERGGLYDWSQIISPMSLVSRRRG